MLITIPDTYVNERAYVIDVLFNEILGLDYKVTTGKIQNYKIALENGNHLIIKDYFWRNNDEKNDIYTEKNLPGSVKQCSVKVFDNDSLIVIYGEPEIEIQNKKIISSIDFIASSFFMLSRWEEMLLVSRDVHDRFPGCDSYAYKSGFINRPVVNEYAEFIWKSLVYLGYQKVRKVRDFRKYITCDVDRVFEPSALSLTSSLKNSARRFIVTKNLGKSVNTLKNYFSVRKPDFSYDEFYNRIFWLMDANEKLNNRLSFYFIPYKTSEKDGPVEYNFKHILPNLLREIHARGHEIGIHPGYETCNNPKNFNASVEYLNEFLIRNNIKQEIEGGRQHFLKYDQLSTPRLWQSNNLKYDSSMAYADVLGYRCGICQEFKMFDLLERKPLKLKQRPLIIMEKTLLDKKYENKGYSDTTYNTLEDIRKTVKKYNGDFTILWHNSSFHSNKDEEAYKYIIQ